MEPMLRHYQVIIKGLAFGQTLENVAEKLGPLLNVTSGQVSQMLAQPNLVVKKGVDFQAAVKYVEALESCGCTCVVQPEAAHSTEATAAAQPFPDWLNEKDERFNSVNETPVSESTKVEEENKWTCPTVSSRGKKFALYGLIGSVLVASVGYGAITFYEAREKRHIAEMEKKENLALVKLASVKPSTFDAVKLKVNYPAEKSDVLDWSKINPKSEMLRKILTALQLKDYATLASPEFATVIEYRGTNPWGFSNNEPPEEEANARRELFEIIDEHPALALEFAEGSKVMSNNQDMDMTWVMEALNGGSKKALAAYIAINEKNRAYADLANLFAGRSLFTVDLSKAAEYFGLAIQSGDFKIGNDSWIVEKILSNGPKLASSARESLLFGANSPPIGNPKDLFKGCKKLSKDIIDPSNNGQGVGVFDNASDDDVRICKSALFFYKNNKDVWYYSGYALQRNQKWGQAKIAYARSAELGNPIAIARYWWLDYMFMDFPEKKKRAIEMLQVESKNGNPWGDYYLGEIFGGAFKEALDYKKAEQGYLKAASAGITYAYLELAEIYVKQNQYDLAVQSWEKASEKFPTASLRLAEQYEKGDGVKRDLDLAKHWYKKASDQGINEASEALARLESSEKTSTIRKDSTPRDSTTQSSTAQNSKRIAPAGTVACLSVQSFYKVNAIEMTGNQYASLPGDCINLPRKGMGEVVQYVNDPIVGSVVLMDAGGSQAYIRLRDLQ